MVPKGYDIRGWNIGNLECEGAPKVKMLRVNEKSFFDSLAQLRYKVKSYKEFAKNREKLGGCRQRGSPLLKSQYIRRWL